MTQLVKPQEGGCWFCQDKYNTDQPKLFTGEFDSSYHEKCLYHALSDDPDNPEARIIKSELDSGNIPEYEFIITEPNTFSFVNRNKTITRYAST